MERQGGHRHAEDRVVVHQSAGAAAQGQGHRARRHRRGHRAAPPRADRRVSHREPRRGSSSITVTCGCSCRNDAGKLVVMPPAIIARTTSAFASPVAINTTSRALRIVAIPIVSASRGTAAMSPPNHNALAARVGSSSTTRWVRAAKRVARFVEADVAVGADAEHHDVDAARGGDRAFVALAFGLEDRRRGRRESRRVPARMLTCRNSRSSMKRR